MKYIALLRGINVGGNNIIPMAQLKVEFRARGFTGVSSYINSGNIIFESDNADISALRQACAALIKESFGLDIATAVVSASALLEAVANAPSWWNADKEYKHNAIFVMPPFSAEEAVEQVGGYNPEYEKSACYGQVIFWSALLKNFSRTRWSKVVSTSVYPYITIRNANTTLKLAELISQQ